MWYNRAVLAVFKADVMTKGCILKALSVLIPPCAGTGLVVAKGANPSMRRGKFIVAEAMQERIVVVGVRLS